MLQRTVLFVDGVLLTVMMVLWNNMPFCARRFVVGCIWSSIGLWVGLACGSKVFTLRWVGLGWVGWVVSCVGVDWVDEIGHTDNSEIQTQSACVWPPIAWAAVPVTDPQDCARGEWGLGAVLQAVCRDRAPVEGLGTKPPRSQSINAFCVMLKAFSWIQKCKN